MTSEQQSAPPETTQKAERAAEMVVDQPESAPGIPQGPPSGDRERCQAQLNTLRYQRATAVEGLQKLDQQIERATLAADSTKLTSLHAKRRTFEQRLEELASEEEILTRHLDAIVEKERVSTVELHLTARRNAHHEGVAIADKLRSALVVVEQLYQSWKEWAETERQLKDIIRSLAPDQMSAAPDFSWATGVDQNFQQAIGQALVELQRSQKDMQRRSAA